MIIRVISESEFTVQGHGVHTAYIELTNAIKNVPGVKVLVNQRGKADVTHLHTVGIYALMYLLFSSGKKVVSAHIVPDSLVGSLVGAKYWLPLAKMYLRAFYNRADLVLAVSEETKHDLEKLSVKKPIRVVHNTIDTARYGRTHDTKISARKMLGISAGSFVVIGAGQIQPRKRVDSFVRAAKSLPDVTFIWVGGMPFKKAAADAGAMQQMIDTAPANVLFPGILPLEQMREYYWSSDVFLLPSDQETFGLVVVEAAAADLPIVLRDIPDYDETFRDCAVMVKNDEFAAAVTTLRDDQTHYRDMISKSRVIAERFDSAEGAKQLVNLFKTLLS